MKVDDVVRRGWKHMLAGLCLAGALVAGAVAPEVGDAVSSGVGSTVSRGCELAAQPVVRRAASAMTTSVGAWRFVIPAG